MSATPVSKPIREGVLTLLREAAAAVGAEAPDDLDDAADFVARGYADSLTMLGILSFVEELTGEPIDYLAVDASTFMSLSGIAAYVASLQAGPLSQRDHCSRPGQ